MTHESLIHKVETTWDNRGVAFYHGSNMYKLVSVILQEGERQIEEAEKVRELNKIRTAEGKSLDAFGYAVNLPRRSGESDDQYRARIQLQYRINSMEGTMDEIAQFMAAMIDAPVEEFNFDTRYDAAPATIFISAQKGVWDSSALTRQTIEEFAGRVVAAGHRVVLEEEGTFLLTNDEQLAEEGHIAENGLTADDIETGGTLAADFIEN